MSNREMPDPREDNANHLSTNECEAIRLMYEDGWSVGELSLAFERKKNTVRRHLHGDCEHRLDIDDLMAG